MKTDMCLLKALTGGTVGVVVYLDRKDDRCDVEMFFLSDFESVLFIPPTHSSCVQYMELVNTIGKPNDTFYNRHNSCSVKVSTDKMPWPLRFSLPSVIDQINSDCREGKPKYKAGECFRIFSDIKHGEIYIIPFVEK